MIIMPVWAWIVLFAIGGIVYLVTLPKRRRDAAEREQLFDEREKRDDKG